MNNIDQKRRLYYHAGLIRGATKAGDINHIITIERMGAANKSLGNAKESFFHLNDALNMCELAKSERAKFRILLLMGWLESDISSLNREVSVKAKPLFIEALENARTLMDYYTKEALFSLGLMIKPIQLSSQILNN